MRGAPASSAMVAAVLLATIGAATTAAPAPALTLTRTAPMTGLERLQKLDRARLAKRSGIGEFDLLGMPGIYYTNVKLGTPAKEYSLQFDTGSDLMWVSCNSCPSCPKTNNFGIRLEFYEPNNSSTSSNISCSDDRCKEAIEAGHSVCQTSDSQNNHCGYDLAYADGATSGYYVSDTMYFDTVSAKGNEHAASPSASVIFGCSNSRSGNLLADGIMGFGKNAPSVILQLNSQGASPKAFSHCLTSSEDGGGILVLGEIVEPGILFTPLVQSQARYNLNMESIALNGQKIHINSSLFTTSNTQGTLVDSGTSLAYLADGVYNPVISAIDNAVPQSVRAYFFDGQLCYIVSSRRGRKTQCALAFKGARCSRVTSISNILGDIVLRDKIFVYDLEEMRLGWVGYNCSLLNKTTVPVTASVSWSLRRHTPPYCSGLMIPLVVAVISIKIIAPWRLD